MKERPPLPMTPLDMLVTTQELQIIKSLLPYFPSSYRNILAIYLKFIEFQTTIKLFYHRNNSSSEELIKSKSLLSPFDLLADLKNYIPQEEAETFNTMLNAFQMMNTFQGDNPSSESFSSDYSENTDFNPSGNYSDMLNQFDSILKGMTEKNERVDGSSGNEKN